MSIRKAVSNEATHSQQQTSDAFGYKWSRRDTYESDVVKENAQEWLVDRYLGGNPEMLNTFLGESRKTILDAGCGSGFSALLLFGERLKDHDFIGVDISSAADVARQRFNEMGIPGTFRQEDLMNMSQPDESVDILFSEGVLHHTDSVRNSIERLTKKLKPGGKFLFYVYKKKAPVREFTDDFIREQLQGLGNDEAWEKLIPLTELGKALGDLDATVSVPENVELLGIPAGDISVQRLFYWYICKMFHNPDMSLDEMNHINFDWFTPLNCHRHTPEEIETFCNGAGLAINELHVENAGITVIATRVK